MIENTTQIAIEKSPSEVFRYLARAENYPAWVQGIREVTPVASGTFSVVSDGGGRPVTMTGRRTAEEKDAVVVDLISDGMFDVEIDFRLAPESSATSVVCTTRITPKKLVFKLMQPLMRRHNQKKIEGDLARLKKVVEARA